MIHSRPIPPITIGWCPFGYSLSFMPSSQVNGHAIITGSSGSGKSVLAKFVSCAIQQSGVPVVTFDFHGDMEIFSQRTYQLGDGPTGEYSIRFLQPTRRALRVFGARGFIDNTIGAIEEMSRRKLGDAQRNALRAVLPELLDGHGVLNPEGDNDGDGSRRGIVPSDLLALLESKKSEAEGSSQRNLYDGLISRVSVLASLNIFENDNALDIEDLLVNGGRIQMLSVPRPVRGCVARILMRMLFDEITAMGPVQRQMYEPLVPFRVYLVVDEAGSVIRRTAEDCIVKTIAKESRKFGVGLLLAAQTLDDLSDEVVANADTHFALPSKSASDARKVEQKLGLSRGALNTGGGRLIGYYQAGFQRYPAHFYPG